MSLLSDLGTTIIVTLLSVSAQVTTLVESKLPHTSNPASTQTFVSLPSVPGSQPGDKSIPRLFLENPAWQQASVGESQGLVSSAAVKNPQDALVNIFCTYRTADRIRYTTGTGFFINPAGVILTNAHVAQFLLLETVSETGNTDCIVRHGDPATPTYEAELLYISPFWIREHAALISDTAPKGTGERDYALLHLTSRIDNTPLPRALPYLTIDTALQDLNRKGTPVTIAGYPTSDPSRLLRGNALPLQIATSTIVDLYTFDTNFADLFTLGGSAVGKQGVSGGPVIDTTGTAIGLVVTRGDDTVQGEGSLNAITLSYVDRGIQEETGLTLATLISSNIAYRASIFQQTIVPYLAHLLEAEL